MCNHTRWKIYGDNKLGFGTCLDCMNEIHLYTLLNSLHERLEAALSEVQEMKAIHAEQVK